MYIIKIPILTTRGVREAKVGFHLIRIRVFFVHALL